MSVTTIKLLSSGELCNLPNDTIPVKSASANVSFYTNNSNMRNFKLGQYSPRGAISPNFLLAQFFETVSRKVELATDSIQEIGKEVYKIDWHHFA